MNEFERASDLKITRSELSLYFTRTLNAIKELETQGSVKQLKSDRVTIGSTRSLQGVDSNSPTYLAEMKFEGQAFKLIHMVDLFTDHEKIK